MPQIYILYLSAVTLTYTYLELYFIAAWLHNPGTKPFRLTLHDLKNISFLLPLKVYAATLKRMQNIY